MNRGDRLVSVGQGVSRARAHRGLDQHASRARQLLAACSALAAVTICGSWAAAPAGAQDNTETTTTARGSGGVTDATTTTSSPSTTAAVDASPVGASGPTGATGATGASSVTGASGAVGAGTDATDATATTASGNTVDTGATSSGTANSTSNGGNDRVLNLIIIALLVLAALIAIATILFWRSTVPERIQVDDGDSEDSEDVGDEDDQFAGDGSEDEAGPFDEGQDAAPVLAPPRVRVGAPAPTAAPAGAVRIEGPAAAPAAGSFNVPPPTHLPAPAERPYAQRPTTGADLPAAAATPAEPVITSAQQPDSSGDGTTPPAPGSWTVPAPSDGPGEDSASGATAAPLPVEKLAAPKSADPAPESSPVVPEEEAPIVVRRNRSKKRASGPWGEGAKIGQRAEIPDPKLSEEDSEFSRGVRIVPAPDAVDRPGEDETSGGPETGDDA